MLYLVSVHTQLGDGSWVAPPGRANLTTEWVSQDYDQTVWVFDLESDPEERHDLSSVNAPLAKSLYKRLQVCSLTSVNILSKDDSSESVPWINCARTL